MKPDSLSETVLKSTRSKAKQYEYDVPLDWHVAVPRDPADLFPLCIAILGEAAARMADVALDLRLTSEDANEISASDLNFAANFFDSYLDAKFGRVDDEYILLLAAAAYYLLDIPGSTDVLIKQIKWNKLQGESRGLALLLYSTLLYQENAEELRLAAELTGPYGSTIHETVSVLSKFRSEGIQQDLIIEKLRFLRQIAYADGTARELLLMDLVAAVTPKRIEQSTWNSLPGYSELSEEQWRPVLQSAKFVKELWPAQRALGESGLFAGKSAAIQMPTSAGKTRSTEIIIRSAFLSGRVTTAVIVAPFRVLCHEVKHRLFSAFYGESVLVEEASDIPQNDFDFTVSMTQRRIIIVTPEKLLYLLKLSPELSKSIGLIIYDEGHQFDSDHRGVTYELLLSALKTLLPDDTQTVLISAVLKNAASVVDWLTNGTGNTVTGHNLVPTRRTLAFMSWNDQRGKLWYVAPDNPDEQEFYVPRVIHQQKLERRGRERIDRYFPEKNESPTVALYLGLKLVDNGGVAIFHGTKASAIKTCERLVDAYDRGLKSSKPIVYSDDHEVTALALLHSRNLGDENYITKCAQIGVFSHHASIPHGIRMAVEHAMQNGLIKMIVCTSTLAQGVNLPIRYLILNNLFQAGERIKVRDFHNLVGRAGRLGMYTEGSVIFADHNLYDDRLKNEFNWRALKKLLNAENSEPCESKLLTLLDPIFEYTQGQRTSALEFINAYTSGKTYFDGYLVGLRRQAANIAMDSSDIEKPIADKLQIIHSIESYLMTFEESSSSDSPNASVEALAEATLAYYLGNENQKSQLVECFKLLAAHINQAIGDSSKRRLFGRTLLGLHESLQLESWVETNLDQLKAQTSPEELLDVIWSILSSLISETDFVKCTKPSALQEAAKLWLKGESFGRIHQYMSTQKVRLSYGRTTREFKLENTVNVCENVISFHGSVIIGAVSELVNGLTIDSDLTNNLRLLQKRTKYGLSNLTAVVFYELGFVDRVIANELASTISFPWSNKGELITAMREKEVAIRNVLLPYPTYFNMKLEEILAE